MDNTVLRVEGMTCQHCGERVTSALRSVPGVVDVQIDWRQGRVQVQHPGTVRDNSLIKAVEKAAADTEHRYSAIFIKDEEGTKKTNRLRGPLAMLLILPLCLLLCGGGVIGISIVGAFLASKWVGVGPGLAVAAVVGFGTWWVLRRRQRVCSICVSKDREGAKS